ncbi:MAG: 3-phenylpropionate/trans-cinnamate dioxygenase ferredoxin reductase component, partial [Actinomycetota bacterium]|nr:3-phenylpropionate/trans-cinnamate dioxygenase ferredoxin reductase component [Actinomycetota bacterium]
MGSPSSPGAGRAAGTGDGTVAAGEATARPSPDSSGADGRPDHVVVVGAGLAGLQTVLALRAAGYAESLTLVGAEARPPYDRPPLSKAVLAGAEPDSTLEADWTGLDVNTHWGRRATGLRPGVLETDQGDLHWDRLVLATGGEPLRLPGADHALVLRTHEDCTALRDRLRPGARLVVVGAGWIGAEVATAAVAAGATVTVVEALAQPLAAVLPAEIGRRMLPWWDGVDLRLGARVDRVEVDAVYLVGGEVVAADVVLVGVGSRPATGWLAGITRTARGAVEVDPGLRVPGRPGVFAVGDCAAWESARYGTRMHVEHWDNALHAPGVVAANVLGGDAVWDPVPYFWSEQWGRMVQYAGHQVGAERKVWREDGDRWAVFWLIGDRLVAALTVDRPRDLVQARKL